MSIDYSVYMGPYVICSEPRRGCLEAVNEYLEDNDERLTTADGVSEPSHIFIPNGSMGTYISPKYDDAALYSVPRPEGAIGDFEDEFEAELSVLRENFCAVTVDFGLMNWAR